MNYEINSSSVQQGSDSERPSGQAWRPLGVNELSMHNNMVEWQNTILLGQYWSTFWLGVKYVQNLCPLHNKIDGLTYLWIHPPLPHERSPLPSTYQLWKLMLVPRQ